MKLTSQFHRPMYFSQTSKFIQNSLIQNSKLVLSIILSRSSSLIALFLRIRICSTAFRAFEFGFARKVIYYRSCHKY